MSILSPRQIRALPHPTNDNKAPLGRRIARIVRIALLMAGVALALLWLLAR